VSKVTTPATTHDWKNGNGHTRPEKFFKVVRGKDMDPLLFDLLSRATPHGTEKTLHDLMPPPISGNKDRGYIRHEDEKGNVWYFVGNTKKHRTMFSCHMDTVHTDNKLPVAPVKTESGFIYGSLLGPDDTGDGKLYHYPSCLGADDKVGMYIMLKMLEKRIPGIYAFHVGEEAGCVGSKWAAAQKHCHEQLKNVDRCIAFDRKGYNNIITKQRGSRCCSDEFAKALATQLNGHKAMPPKVDWFPDPSGAYTDSASYVDLVGECTNLSVGYFHQHGNAEHLDYLFLTNSLLPAILDVKWSELPTVRKKGEKEAWENNWRGGSTNYQNTPPYVRSSTPSRSTVPSSSTSSSSDYISKLNHVIWNSSPYVYPVLTFQELVQEVNLQNQTKGTDILVQAIMKRLTHVSADTNARDLLAIFKAIGVLDKEVASLTKENQGLVKEVDDLTWRIEADNDASDYAWSQAGEAFMENQKLAAENEKLRKELAECRSKNKVVTIIPKNGRK
jgi:hypothetical protein